MLKAFDAEHNDAIDPRNKHVQTKEESAMGLRGNTIPTTTTPPHDFPLFSKLPTELRVMIWREVLPGPRLVEANFQFEDNVYRFGSAPMYCMSRTSPPALLSVCYESREEALKKYSLCFAMEAEQPRIYFDMNVDNLFITCDDPMDLLTALDAAGGLAMPSFTKLRHLTLALCPEIRYGDPRVIVFLIEHLRGLETFSLVAHEKHNCCVRWRDVALRELRVAEEPEGIRGYYDSLMDAGSLRSWQTPPVLRYLGICETASVPCSEDCLEKTN